MRKCPGTSWTGVTVIYCTGTRVGGSQTNVPNGVSRTSNVMLLTWTTIGMSVPLWNLRMMKFDMISDALPALPTLKEFVYEVRSVGNH